jgi:hypothetical protein
VPSLVSSPCWLVRRRAGAGYVAQRDRVPSLRSHTDVTSRLSRLAFRVNDGRTTGNAARLYVIDFIGFVVHFFETRREHSADGGARCEAGRRHICRLCGESWRPAFLQSPPKAPDDGSRRRPTGSNLRTCPHNRWPWWDSREDVLSLIRAASFGSRGVFQACVLRGPTAALMTSARLQILRCKQQWVKGWKKFHSNDTIGTDQ